MSANRRPGGLFLVDFAGLGSACLAVGVLRTLERRYPGVRYAYPENALLADPELRRAAGLRGHVGPFPARWRRFDPSDREVTTAFLDEHELDTVVNFRNPDLVADPRYPAFREWCERTRRRLRWHDLHGRTDVAGRHVQDRMISVLASAGFELGEPDLEWLRDPVPSNPGRPRIGVFCGASGPTKRWPADRWEALAATLRSEGAQIVVLAGSDEGDLERALDLGERLHSTVPGREVSVAPAGGVRQLVARLRSLSVLVSNDTGVGHLAAACGVPVVSLFLSTVADVWKPRSGATVALQSLVGVRCPNQRPLQGNCTRHYDRCDAPCHTDLSLDVVAASVRGSLARRPTEPAGRAT